MTQIQDMETSINWLGRDTTVEVYTTHPVIIRKMERMEAEEVNCGNVGRSFIVPIEDAHQIFSSMKKSSTKRETNRPTKTHDEKVAHLFRLRKGKMEKASGKALTKSQTKKLMAYCEERVTAKEQDGQDDE